MLLLVGMTIDTLAERINATVKGDGSQSVSGCAGLEDAGPQHISFLANRKYVALVAQSKAGAVILSVDDAGNAGDRTVLIADDPYFAFRQAMIALHGWRRQPAGGVNELAHVDSTAIVGEQCTIEPFAYVAPGAKIGNGCVIHPHCFIGNDVVIGDDCTIYSNVTIYENCVLGNRVTLHAGCVVGQDGFGYATYQGEHHKIPQAGNVVIEDDVELGANCAIDRATVGSTVIGQGSKLSDLVAIGHGTVVGHHNLLVAQVGLAGSITTGQHVVIGGQSGAAGHLNIGDHVQLAGKSGVVADLTEPGQYGGFPAVPLPLAKRNWLLAPRLPELVNKFSQVVRRLEKIEGIVQKQLPANPNK